jgi:hypothetical protein
MYLGDFSQTHLVTLPVTKEPWIGPAERFVILFEKQGDQGPM